MEIVFSNKEEDLKVLYKVFERLNLVVTGTKMSEGDEISSNEFMEKTKAVHRRISRVMERNAAQKQFVLKWKKLYMEGDILEKKNILRAIYLNEVQEDGSYRPGVSKLT